MARTLVAVAAVVLAAIGVAAAVSVLSSRDEATVPGEGERAGPGVPRPAGDEPQVAPGNVVLLYSDERLTRALRRLARDTAGAVGDPALVAAGQAVVLRREPNQPVAVVALTATHRLQAASAGAPELRSFVEYWLGRSQ